MKDRGGRAGFFRGRLRVPRFARSLRLTGAYCLCLLAVSSARAGDPAPFVPDLAPLRNEALWPVPGQDSAPLPPNANAVEHARALRADPLHEHHFVVREVAGAATANRVVFLIPQFHRNPLMPIGWTSLGTAIMEVQGNLDVLISRLTRVHGLRCIGSEGNWLNDMAYSPELRQAAQWHHELGQRQSQAMRHLQKEPMLDSTDAIAGDLERISRILTTELRRHVQILDGAGIALSRPDTHRDVHRFGIEDPQLNQRALELLAQRREVDEALARHIPASQSAVADAMGVMWLDEISAYEEDVLVPLQDSIASADRLRLHLRQAMALDAAEGLGRFVSLAKHVRTSVVQPEAVAQYTDYYREVSTAVPADTREDKPVTFSKPGSEALRDQLQAQRDKLQAEYERVTFAQREAAAARILWERMGTKNTCAVIMGAAHTEGLRKALLEVSGGNLGIITVTPYDFDTENTSSDEDEK